MAAGTSDMGGTDVRSTSEQGTPELHIVLDRVRMSQLNVTSQQAIDALRTTLGGRVVSFLRPTGKAQHPRVIFDASSPEADLIRQWATQYSTQ